MEASIFVRPTYKAKHHDNFVAIFYQSKFHLNPKVVDNKSIEINFSRLELWAKHGFGG
jgi:hypothetical protein